MRKQKFQRKSPPLFPSHVDNTDANELEKSLKKDLMGLDRFPKKNDRHDISRISTWIFTGCFWTSQIPCLQKVLDDLLQLMKDLEFGHIFAHGDEQVYARLAHIILKGPKIYQFILMCGFQKLRVRQKTIHKRNATGTSDSAIEGRHYYQSMRIHKEMFCALVQQSGGNYRQLQKPW